MNRFSAYYARQGQPDFDFKKETKLIYDKVSVGNSVETNVINK